MLFRWSKYVKYSVGYSPSEPGVLVVGGGVAAHGMVTVVSTSRAGGNDLNCNVGFTVPS